MFVAAFTTDCLLLICFLSLMITVHAYFLYDTFLGAFAKLRKATKLRRVCPSVFLHGTTQLPLDGFSRNLII
jgi:hypothetical protein